MFGTAGLLVQAALKRGTPDVASRHTITLPGVTFESQVSPWRTQKIRRFDQLVEWRESGKQLHPCVPHLMAFSLQMKLLLSPGFPFPLLGLVHIQNRIRQFAPLPVDQSLEIRCRFGDIARTAAGWQFSLVTDAYHGGAKVWQEESVNLYRIPASETRKSLRQTSAPFDEQQRFILPTGLGRDYARLSGDYNLIHLWSASARWFGFRQHIAHGMWSFARCLSAIDACDAFEVEARFLRPIFLPAEVVFSHGSTMDGEVDFALHDLPADVQHLAGRIVHG